MVGPHTVTFKVLLKKDQELKDRSVTHYPQFISVMSHLRSYDFFFNTKEDAVDFIVGITHKAS